MGNRSLPIECEHGVIVNGGDFADSESCPECDAPRGNLQDDILNVSDGIYNGILSRAEQEEVEQGWERILDHVKALLEASSNLIDRMSVCSEGVAKDGTQWKQIFLHQDVLDALAKAVEECSTDNSASPRDPSR